MSLKGNYPVLDQTRLNLVFALPPRLRFSVSGYASLEIKLMRTGWKGPVWELVWVAAWEPVWVASSFSIRNWTRKQPVTFLITFSIPSPQEVPGTLDFISQLLKTVENALSWKALIGFDWVQFVCVDKNWKGSSSVQLNKWPAHAFVRWHRKHVMCHFGMHVTWI